MFKNLLKHDIKDSYLEVVILNGLLVVFSLITFLGAKVRTESLFALGIIAWAAALSAVFFILLRTIIKNFHSKLFTDCGYLTLTTPVSIDKILISKILVSMLWILTTFVSVVVCIVIVSMALVNPDVVFASSNYEVLANLLLAVREAPLEILKGIALALSSVLSFLTTLIFVLVLTNTGRMKKHKMLKSILIYIVLVIIVIEIGRPITTLTGTLIFTSVWSVVFYFISRYFIRYKLELE